MQAADNAQRDGSLQAIGSAQSNGPVTHIQSIGITQTGRLRRGLAFETDQRQIRDRVTADHHPIALLSIGKSHANILHLLHHMGVGEHKALSVDDHA